MARQRPHRARVLQLHVPGTCGLLDSIPWAGAGAYDEELGDFILANREADTTDDPEATALSFLQGDLRIRGHPAGWNRQELERSISGGPKSASNHRSAQFAKGASTTK